MKKIISTFIGLICISVILHGQSKVLVYSGAGYGAYNQTGLFDLAAEEALECGGEVTTITTIPNVADVTDKDVMMFSAPDANFSAAVANEIANRLTAGAVLFVIGEWHILFIMTELMIC